MFIQRGVPGIMKYDGRTSQGRGYFLISSYAPASVWFFMGYFNIAALSGGVEVLEQDEEVDGEEDGESDASHVKPRRRTMIRPRDKDAYVTNSRTNQNSARLLFHQFMEGKSLEQMRMVKQHIKEAALTAYFSLKPKLGKNKGSYTMFGFDYVVQDDLNVKVLETNCNCELFANEKKFGAERVAISTNLVQGMMDIVLASQLNPSAFQSLMEHYVSAGTEQERTMKSKYESLQLDEPDQDIRKSWELLYTEVVDPPFSILDLKKSCEQTMEM